MRLRFGAGKRRFVSNGKSGASGLRKPA